MNKHLIVILLCAFAFSTAFGQTIKSLEQDLSRLDGFEKDGDKIDKAKKLQQKDPFNYDAADYICRYYRGRKIDSVSIYFDNLIEKYPNNVEPYLLRIDLLSLEFGIYSVNIYNKQKIKYLNLAYQIDNSDRLVIFKLAETYYKDFLFPFEKEKDWGFNFEFDDDFIDTNLVEIDTTFIVNRRMKNSTFEHPADSALKYFYRLWDLSPDDRENIYYPIKQLECYLNRLENSPIPKDTNHNFKQCFFPSWYFANLSENWQCDSTIDYLFEIESGMRTARWLEKQLTDLKENCLFDKELSKNTTIYRFTWIRTFHNPIAIRIENTNNEIMLYWKVGRGAGGYDPRGLKKSGKRKLTINQWETFLKLVEKSNFDNLANRKYIPMPDGATWTLERKASKEFKAHNTNLPSNEIKNACLFLLDLTDMKVERIY